MKVKEESEKIGLKLNIQKNKIMASHHFMANRWETLETVDRLYFGGAKITAMKLEDACFLEEKL